MVPQCHCDAIAEGHGPGLQVWGSSLDGESQVSLVRGLARPGYEMRPWTLHPFWCATKPVLFHVAAALVEQSGRSPDDDLRPLLPSLPAEAISPTSIRELGTHWRGFDEPSLAEVMCTAPASRLSMALAHLRTRTQKHQAYSEWLVWVLLEALVEEQTSERCAVVLDDALSCCGLNGIRFDVDGFDLDDVGCWWGRTGDSKMLPMIGHTLWSELAKLTPAIGGLASAQGLGEWYRLLGQHLSGDASRSAEGLFASRSFTAELRDARREAVQDPILGRVCSFAAGLSDPLGGHGFSGTPAREACGQAGWLGGVIGLLDSDEGLAGCVFLNGVDLAEPQSLEPVRREIVTWVYKRLKTQART